MFLFLMWEVEKKILSVGRRGKKMGIWKYKFDVKVTSGIHATEEIYMVRDMVVNVRGNEIICM